MSIPDELSEKLYIGLVTTDFDYISTRLLLRASLFPTAAATANVVLDRYIKLVFLCRGREDLIKAVRGWRGNESHNVPKMIELYNSHFEDKVDLTDKEKETLDNIYTLYCFRYGDAVFEMKRMAGIVKRDMYTIDKFVSFFRKRIELGEKHKDNTILGLLLSSDKRAHVALSTGNADLRQALLYDNKYFQGA